uniref:Uncharacterized protein n=1 Tax=Ascaris lumbricoides TaxID=6252 RepID=A0A0M3I2D9_ASCLU
MKHFRYSTGVQEIEKLDGRTLLCKITWRSRQQLSTTNEVMYGALLRVQKWAKCAAVARNFCASSCRTLNEASGPVKKNRDGYNKLAVAKM